MPTTDELRAAAERVRLCRSRSMLTVYGVESLPDATALYFDDAYAIAEARLSQPQPATDEQIAELKRLCEAASALPWSFHAQTHCEVEALVSDNDPDAEPENVLYGRNESANWDFVCAACNAIPTIIARLERAEAELKLWRPMTPEEIEDELENVESVPISDEKIAAMVEKITDPLYRPTEPEYVTLLVKVKQLQAEVERLRKELDRVYLRMVEADQMPLMMKPLAFTAIRMDLASAIAAQQEERNG